MSSWNVFTLWIGFIGSKSTPIIVLSMGICFAATWHLPNHSLTLSFYHPPGAAQRSIKTWAFERKLNCRFNWMSLKAERARYPCCLARAYHLSPVLCAFLVIDNEIWVQNKLLPRPRENRGHSTKLFLVYFEANCYVDAISVSLSVVRNLGISFSILKLDGMCVQWFAFIKRRFPCCFSIFSSIIHQIAKESCFLELLRLLQSL